MPALSTDWYPDKVSARVVKDGAQVGFQTLLLWDAHDPADVPLNYGIETEVTAYNEDLTGIRPYWCDSPHGSDFRDQFFAVNDGYDWLLTTTDAAVTPYLEAYADTDNLDGCDKQTFSIGLRYPQAIPEAPNGTHAVLIEIEADAGLQESRIFGMLQLVDDLTCPTPGTIFLPHCMGDALIPPPGVEPSARFLNEGRRWFTPDRCWIADDFLTTVVPISPCGGAEPAPGINVTDLYVGGSSGPLTVSLTHSACDWVDSTSPPSPFEPYSTAFPYAFDTSRATSVTQLGDVRAWIGDQEIAITPTFWTLEIPTTGAYFQLSSDVSSILIGDGSIADRNAFARDGTLSFRIDDGEPNAFRVQNMESFLPGSGINTDDSLVVAGSSAAWSDQAGTLTAGHFKEGCGDVVPSTDGVDSSGITFDGAYYFPAEDVATYSSGLGVYTDSGGFELLSDDYEVTGLMVHDGVLYFMGSVGSFDPLTWTWTYYRSIYSYDGTTIEEVPGTDMIVPTKSWVTNWGGPTKQTVLVELDGKMYFFGTDSTNGYQLWSYEPATGDVELEGPALLSVPSTTYGIAPSGLVRAGAELYFVAPTVIDGNGHGNALGVWTHDGSGVPEVTDLPASEGSTPNAMVVANGNYYISARPTDLDPYPWLAYLWRIEGTTATTVTNTGEPTAPSWGDPLIGSGGHIYFVAYSDIVGAERLYVYDGTDTGVVETFPVGSYSTPIGAYEGNIVFNVNVASDYEPWIYNGTSLSAVGNLTPSGSSYPIWLGTTDGYAYLSAGGALWVLNEDGDPTQKDPIYRWPETVGVFRR